ncbi:MAG: hypothetical protein E6G97_06705 [Alphaproteobacteria bacterium]|nr:MAG: hypothetical protein E6G97_06705 [Alphaproteobacteria bacterium]
MRPPVLVAMALALAFGGASAQAPGAPPAPDLRAEEASLHAYGDNDKSCQEWTDTCRSCRRSDTGEPLCPNIGIACQPQAITCVRRAEEKK